MKNEIEKYQFSFSMSNELNTEVDHDEDGVSVIYNESKPEQIKKDIRFCFDDYIENVHDELPDNIKETLTKEDLVKNVNIEVSDVDIVEETDSNIVGWDYKSENTIEKNTSSAVEHFNVKINFENGSKEVQFKKHEIDVFLGFLKDNFAHEIEDENFSIEKQKPANRTKIRR